MTTLLSFRGLRPRQGRLWRPVSRVLARRQRATSQAHVPSCPLQARPVPQPAPAPSWEELLGRR